MQNSTFQRKQIHFRTRPESLLWVGNQNAKFDLAAGAKCTNSLFGQSPRVCFGLGTQNAKCDVAANAKCTSPSFTNVREIASGRQTKCKIGSGGGREMYKVTFWTKPESLVWAGNQNAKLDLAADAKCTQSLFVRSLRLFFGPTTKIQNLAADEKCTNSFFGRGPRLCHGPVTMQNLIWRQT